MQTKRTSRRLSFLLAALLNATLIPAALRAQETPPEAPRVSAGVTVVATRLEEPVADATVRVVTRAEIDAMPARSLAELLALLPGMDVRRRGIDGVQADVGIRGADFNGTLILVDGVPVNDPETNHLSMDLDVPIDAIERIEVLPGGAGSALWGSAAIGGVVHVVTRGAALGRARGQFEARYGHGTDSLDAGTARVAVRASDSFTFALDAGRSEWAGFREDTESASQTLRATTRLDIPNGSVDLALGYAGRRYGAYAFYGSRFPDQQETTRTRSARLSADLKVAGWSLEPMFSFRAHHDDFVLVRENPAFYENRHDADRGDARLVARHALGAGAIAFGLEGGRETIASTNLGSHGRNHGALFVEASRPFLAADAAKGGVRVGLRADSYESFGSRLSPFLGLSFAPERALRFRASVGTAFRIPTFLDLYYSDPQTLGNPDLRAEKATNVEAGAAWDVGPLTLDGAFFYRHGTDLIDYVRSSPTEKYTARNVRRVDTSGIEATLELAKRPAPLTRLGISATYVFTDLAALSREADGATEGLYVLDPLHVKWDLVAAAKLLGATAWARLGYLSRPTFADGVWLLDARVGKQLLEGEILEIYAEGQNLGNTRYQERPGVPLPGRVLLAGFHLTW